MPAGSCGSLSVSSGKTVLGVFFFQHRSMLDYQRKMKEKLGRNNLETIFGVTAMPTDTWIREQMDRIQPEKFSGFFNSTLKTVGEAGLVDTYRILDGGVTTCYHSMLAGTIVRPGSASVMPVAAGKRWLTSHGEE
jgi:hypothetical protein